MFNFFKKKEKPPSPVTIRDTLFGDMPLSGWPSDSGLNMEPWSFFVQAATRSAPPCTATSTITP